MQTINESLSLLAATLVPFPWGPSVARELERD